MEVIVSTKFQIYLLVDVIPSFASLTAVDAIEILGPQVDSIFSSSSDHLS